MQDQPSTPATPIDDDEATDLVEAYDAAGDDPREAKAASLMTDAYLLRAYWATGGEPGDPEADALLSEIEHRNLDI